MKHYIFTGVTGIFFLISCHGNAGHQHETKEHPHNTEQHTHCADEHSHEESVHAHNHDEPTESPTANEDEIILSPARAQAAGVKSDTIHRREFHRVIRTSGRISAAQGNESIVVATVAGIVSLNSKLTEGTSVNKGTPLLNLSSRHITGGDPAQHARVVYETARKEYERMKALADDKIVSEKDFAQAQQTYEQARINYEAVSGKQSSGGQIVSASISGYIKDIFVKEGDYAEVGQPLVSITQNRKLFLRAEVSEKYYSALHDISSANFRIPYNNKTYTLKELNGSLLSYGKSADGTNGYYIPVIFEFDNKGDIIPGSFVEVFLLGNVAKNTVVLPRSALTEEQGSFFVYIQVDDECYRKQLVEIGADNGKEVEIRSGVSPGNRVVTEGAYQVKLAAVTNALPAHSHEH